MKDEDARVKNEDAPARARTRLERDARVVNTCHGGDEAVRAGRVDSFLHARQQVVPLLIVTQKNNRGASRAVRQSRRPQAFVNGLPRGCRQAARGEHLADRRKRGVGHGAF